jgi:hypothetical protein
VLYWYCYPLDIMKMVNTILRIYIPSLCYTNNQKYQNDSCDSITSSRTQLSIDWNNGKQFCYAYYRTDIIVHPWNCSLNFRMKLILFNVVCCKTYLVVFLSNSGQNILIMEETLQKHDCSHRQHSTRET